MGITSLNFTYLFVACMLGHFVGDYLLQNQWMAIRKSQSGWRGHSACTVHVILYTLAVCLFSGLWSLWFGAAIAIPHWIIDRWSLAWYWLDFKNPVKHTKIYESGPLCAQTPADLTERNIWKLAFAAPVYILNDNTLHWVCIWLTLKYFL